MLSSEEAPAPDVGAHDEDTAAIPSQVLSRRGRGDWISSNEHKKCSVVL